MLADGRERPIERSIKFRSTARLWMSGRDYRDSGRIVERDSRVEHLENVLKSILRDAPERVDGSANLGELSSRSRVDPMPHACGAGGHVKVAIVPVVRNRETRASELGLDAFERALRAYSYEVVELALADLTVALEALKQPEKARGAPKASLPADLGQILDRLASRTS
jgi:hypothetical protein